MWCRDRCIRSSLRRGRFVDNTWWCRGRFNHFQSFEVVPGRVEADFITVPPGEVGLFTIPGGVRSMF